MSDDLTAVNVALDRCETAHAPDPRVAYYDIEARRNKNSGISLHGTVQSEHLREKAIDAARNAIATSVDTDDLTVFDAVAQTRTIQTSIASVRDAPDGDSGLLTEALYGARVTAFEYKSNWTRVRVPDGYIGWVRTDCLTDSVEGTFDALLQKDCASIDGLETLYAGTDCEITSHSKRKEHTINKKRSTNSETVTVRFRTGASMELPADTVVKPRPVPTRETVITHAQQYLEGNVPYLWGGMTTEGIDCSGFVWMTYRMSGLTLPRDSDQQRKVGEPVNRNELRPGDLLFFPGHIAISLGGTSFIHSSGDTNGPTTNSLDPNAEHYSESLDESFEEARRIL